MHPCGVIKLCYICYNSIRRVHTCIYADVCHACTHNKKNRKWIVHVAYRFFLFPSKHTFSHECLKWCNQLLLKPQFYLFSIIIHYSCFHFGWKIMPIISISYCRWKFFRVWGRLKIEPNNFPWNHRHAQQNTLSAF